MLSTAELDDLSRLALTSRRRLIGEIAGEHRSRRRGNTLDFADFRDYAPGDDIRRLDLHHLARHDELRIKLYEADEDLVVRVVLDCSGSMSLHGKAATAAEVVAALGAMSLARGDAVTLAVVPEAEPPQRFRGRAGLAALVARLTALEARLESGAATPMAGGARRLLSQAGPPGMVVVVGDLLTPEWHTAISTFPIRGADLLVVHLLADAELEPELAGDLSLVDTETGERVAVSLDRSRIERYGKSLAEWRDDVRRRTLAVGGRYLPLRAGCDVIAELRLALARQAVSTGSSSGGSFT